ncbi:MAG: efflux RND transporter periplasmic adaptor subunit [Patescibacteria group bacterium]|nr:efflux RND transporter periplasmic adaptor subunit [Patescibacteria group bacterium]MDE2015692.1 efflux RND transporter periplasmic adaptor subunit [Patescibacteria group bacterium]MDE2226750.1 efflux RND transporter periplasmic adaptor subunit [Patescibacteria group bacterium]
MKKIIKKHWIISGVVVLLLILGGYFIFGKKSAVKTDFTEAKLDNLVQTVSVTGNIKPAESVDLAFEKSGTIRKVNADVGDKVYAGEALVELDNSEFSTQLAKAQADLASQQATLDKAKFILNNYYNDVVDVINDAYTKANDAVRNQTDALFTYPETSPKLVFSTNDSQNEIDLQSQRLVLADRLNSWLKDFSKLQRNSQSDILDNALIESESNLNEVRKFLDFADKAVVDSVFLPQSTAATYKNDINTGRAEVDTALTSVVGKEQDIGQEKATITSDEAEVQSYEASVENIKAQIAKTSLVSPINGVVTVQNAKVGQIATANVTMTSVISASRFDIEAYVPEADIAKINVDDTTSLTLDAYGSAVNFAASVIKIDPGETVIEGVPTYKVTLRFTKEDARIKSGMTANLDILTAKRDNVIVIPQRSVVTKSDGTTYVLLKTSIDGTTREQTVQTGIRGSDGNIEIVSGLKEGDMITTFGE